MSATYSTRQEAIQREVVDPIEASGVVKDAYAEFDIEAMATTAIGDYSTGYARRLDHDDFWRVVEVNEK